MTGQLGSESWMRRDASVELGTLRERCACEPEDFEALDTLANIIEAYAAEVKRLMVLLNNEQNAAHENVRQLREASAVTAVNFGKAQLEIAQLRTKLARLEALVRKLTEAIAGDESGCVNPCNIVHLAEAVDEALSDPQPSAAPTPKGEPYNGW